VAIERERSVLIFSILLLFFIGCDTIIQSPLRAEAQEVQKDTLSYGMVTSKVQKGITTQEEIIRLFGAPNITTINLDGEEVWMYDRISTESHSGGWSEGRRFNTFFGLGLVGNESYKGEGSRSSTTRTLTVIISFNKEKTVKTYSARATQF
jgi:hypothetical protein